MTENETSTRWQRRSAGARALRWAVLCAPVGASVAAAWAVHGQLPAVRGPVDRLWHLLVLGLVSTVVVVLVDRLARRLLPLVTLLDLSMLFPDRAPSRLAGRARRRSAAGRSRSSWPGSGMRAPTPVPSPGRSSPWSRR